jgi:hypothetical protein
MWARSIHVGGESLSPLVTRVHGTSKTIIVFI